MADGGTILLDEIGEMPLALQTKLLRVLQDPLVYRIGGIKARPVNVRVISSTNRDLRSLVKERRFRQDLFYRLQVVEIHIPLCRRGLKMFLLLLIFILCITQKIPRSKTSQSRRQGTVVPLSLAGECKGN